MHFFYLKLNYILRLFRNEMHVDSMTKLCSILVAHPSSSVLKSPAKLGLYATRNFYVNYHDSYDDKNISLGVWHILPNYMAKKFSSELGLTEVILFALFI